MTKNKVNKDDPIKVEETLGLEEQKDLVVDDYVAPVVTELVVEPPKPVVKPVVEKKVTYNKPLDVIGVKQLKGVADTVVTDIMTQRIKRHMEYLNGTVGFKDQEDRINEQVTFIETIGNTLRLPYEQYALVTNVLINEIQANLSLFKEGMAFRFTKGLDRTYPVETITTYQTYVTFLTIIASNWKNRHRLDRLVDLTYAVNKLDKTGKENTTRYFKQLVARS